MCEGFTCKKDCVVTTDKRARASKMEGPAVLCKELDSERAVSTLTQVGEEESF